MTALPNTLSAGPNRTNVLPFSSRRKVRHMMNSPPEKSLVEQMNGLPDQLVATLIAELTAILDARGRMTEEDIDRSAHFIFAASVSGLQQVA